MTAWEGFGIGLAAAVVLCLTAVAAMTVVYGAVRLAVMAVRALARRPAVADLTVAERLAVRGVAWRGGYGLDGEDEQRYLDEKGDAA